ncbi:hypothetical protein M3Y97_00749300 [Aphelenchoides bicaudatus]|nr:hypothetical protein M3Y97_00749300 [Aphelenchoides bicaudatus]
MIGNMAMSCEQASRDLKSWMILGIILSSVLNTIIIGLFIWVFFMIKSFRSISDEIVSSTHWLSRTTVRVGLGPTAKKALLDYAKTKPELQKLVATQTK